MHDGGGVTWPCDPCELAWVLEASASVNTHVSKEILEQRNNKISSLVFVGANCCPERSGLLFIQKVSKINSHTASHMGSVFKKCRLIKDVESQLTTC